MQLGALNKLRAILHEKQPLSVTTSRTRAGKSNKTNKPKAEKTTAIVLKEQKRSVRIMCWNCNQRLWVMKSSRCHILGLCSHCIGNFDPATGTVKRGQ